MKKFLLFPILVFLTAVIVPSCSGDEEEEIFTPPTTGDSINGGSNGDDIIGGDSIIIGGDSIIIGGDSINATITKAFTGTLIVNDTYTQDSIYCEITIENASQSAILNLYNVKFAEEMPVSINMSLADIPCTTLSQNVFKFRGDSIVPTMGVAPVPAYTFYQIDGIIENYTLAFKATLTKGTLVFSGMELRTFSEE